MKVFQNCLAVTQRGLYSICVPSVDPRFYIRVSDLCVISVLWNLTLTESDLISLWVLAGFSIQQSRHLQAVPYWPKELLISRQVLTSTRSPEVTSVFPCLCFVNFMDPKTVIGWGYSSSMNVKKLSFIPIPYICILYAHLNIDLYNNYALLGKCPESQPRPALFCSWSKLKLAKWKMSVGDTAINIVKFSKSFSIQND